MSTPTHISDRSVVIAGAGPAGAVAALLLARSGAHVTVLERCAPSSAVGAGLLLQPNGLAVLYALGLRDALHSASTRSSTIAIRNDRGRVIVQSQVPDYGNGLDHVLALRRSHLAAVLDAALCAASGIEVRRESEVVNADPSGLVTYTNGIGEDSVSADLIIGADGAHSAVRRSGSFGDRVRPTGRTYVRGIVTGTFDVEAGEYWTSLGLFGNAPLGDGTTYFFADATARPIARAVAAGDVDAFRVVWAEALPPLSPLIDAISPDTPLLVNDVDRVDCNSFVDHRLVVIGDAAHAMAPTLGQGANSAFVDGAVLADELQRHDDIDAALVAYDRRRRTAVQRVQRDADRVARLSSTTSALGRAVRDRALRAANRPKAAKRRYDASLQHDPVDLTRMVAEVAKVRATLARE